MAFRFWLSRLILTNRRDQYDLLLLSLRNLISSALIKLLISDIFLFILGKQTNVYNYKSHLISQPLTSRMPGILRVTGHMVRQNKAKPFIFGLGVLFEELEG